MKNANYDADKSIAAIKNRIILWGDSHSVECENKLKQLQEYMDSMNEAIGVD